MYLQVHTHARFIRLQTSGSCTLRYASGTGMKKKTGSSLLKTPPRLYHHLEDQVYIPQEEIQSSLSSRPLAPPDALVSVPALHTSTMCSAHMVLLQLPKGTLRLLPTRLLPLLSPCLERNQVASWLAPIVRKRAPLFPLGFPAAESEASAPWSPVYFSSLLQFLTNYHFVF